MGKTNVKKQKKKKAKNGRAHHRNERFLGLKNRLLPADIQLTTTMTMEKEREKEKKELARKWERNCKNW